MALRSGRLEKRIRLAVPVELSTLADMHTTERTSTEDVCPIGARVVIQQPKEKNECVVVRSLVGGVQTQARVVYCQRLSTGYFAVGLQFLGVRIKEW